MNTNVGSFFDCLSEPSETYKEGCFIFEKWLFDSDSQDIKYIVTKRTFITLHERIFDWIELFPYPETIRIEAKRLIWDMKYDDFENNHFKSPMMIALYSLKLACDLHRQDFFDNLDKCIEVIQQNSVNKKYQKHLYELSFKKGIKLRAEDLRKIIGEKKIENIKRMWGAIDEAILRA